MNKALKITAFALAGIGALNWGLGIFDINLVTLIAGTGMFAKIVYGAIGASGLIVLSSLFSK